MRRVAALALLLTLPLCACAPKPEAAAPAALALDCSMPFAAQTAKLTAQPHLVPAPHAPGEPYAYYSTEDGHASYLITLKGAPGYPAILMQQASGGQVTTTGCPYGDPKGYKQLVAYLDSLKTWTRR
ncbi:MAG TPA: hypothetical protein VHW05_06375 [Phenylobacterium sp.]|nr:hypothetical protein [Phenylobacterium sp.]